MNLLSINNLSKAYGAKVLFNKISFGINYGEKVALVAKNGSGKTTLFKILKGIEDSKNVPFERVLYAIGIRYVGETVAKKLALHFLEINY